LVPTYEFELLSVIKLLGFFVIFCSEIITVKQQELSFDSQCNVMYNFSEIPFDVTY